MKTRLFVADDHPIFLRGLKEVLADDPSLEIAGEASGGEAALAGIRSLAPDIAILDVEMPGLTGFQVAEILQREETATRIVILTLHRDETLFNKAMDLGVKAYVLKENAVLDILGAVEAVSQGRYYISPLISDFLVRRSMNRPPEPAVVSATAMQTKVPDAITPAERRILERIAAGKSTKEIAAELHISEKTVENQRGSICKKLGLTGSFALNKWVLQQRGVA